MKRGALLVIIIIVLIVVFGFYFWSSKTKCIQEGNEIGVAGKCCGGLEKINIYSDENCEGYAKSLWYCSDCGNNNCEKWEDKCNCPEDCQGVLEEQCAKLGESVLEYTEYGEPVKVRECCEGLISKDPKNVFRDGCEVSMSGYKVICLACGDGTCDSEYENECNCPEDCS